MLLVFINGLVAGRTDDDVDINLIGSSSRTPVNSIIWPLALLLHCFSLSSSSVSLHVAINTYLF